jgi:hypothetical protein
MNPHASSKCARRLFMALAAITGIVFLAGCGSSSSTPVNQEGFTDASLSGTYVFSSSGTDVNGAPIAIAGAFTANGSTSSPSITAGTVDIVDPEFENDGGPPSFTAAQAVSSGSYEVSSDGRGQVTLNIAQYGAYKFDFALDSTSGGVISEFDSNGTGSGTLSLQTAITSFTPATYSFSVAGANGGVTGPLALAGAFSVDASGNVSGIEDYNDNLIVDSSGLTLEAGVATLGSGTGPGQIPIASASFPLTFDFYPIDSTHFKLIETDYLQFVSGDAYTQTGGATIPTSSMAFTLEGGVSAPLGIGGFITISGTSTNGLADVNDGGTVVGGTSFSGTATTPGTDGRVVLATSGVGDAVSTLVAYPSASGVVLLELDSNSLTEGLAVTSAGVAPANSTGYAFDLSAINTNDGEGDFEEDDIAQFTTNSSGGSFTGVADINDEGTTSANNAITGTYGAAQTSGAYSLTATLSNSDVLADFNAYPAASGQFLILETDSNQIGTGVFFAQTSPTAGVAQATAPRVASVVHTKPLLRKHAPIAYQHNVH